MDKEQEILAISRLVFDLTRIDGGDLDDMLGRLHELLCSLPGIRVLPHSLILLYNSRGLLLQAAQFGLPPAWDCIDAEVSPYHLASEDDDQVVLSRSVAARLPLPMRQSIPADAACFMLPLRDNGRLIGKALIFVDPGWQADAIEFEFMGDLAQALSVLVCRLIINETLRVREVELEDARTDAIRRLGTASEYRDNETGMHIMRMTHIATAIAKAMGLSAEERELLSICAPMHDVGKIGIPDAILLKPGRLSSDEYEVMKGHTGIGKRLLDGDDALIQAARDIAASHHEHWDGGGYPEGLAGEDIPLLARICAVSDVFDALTSRRPYKDPWPVDQAVAWVREKSGSHFDPAVVAGFMQALPEVMRIRELYRDDIIDPNQVLDLPELPPHQCEWVRWDDALSVGIDVIDEHHRYLFDLTNDLYEVVSTKRGSREVARVMKALDQYVQVHFRAEERMMDHHGYHALGRQRHQHGEFEARLREFYAELHDNPLTAQFDVLVYLRTWLVRHILHEDARLRELVN
ncbi:bacteriohemerythrin [Azonexus sp. R2A61]|uniref:bacteriohemerythrin n=1 Tax=Azonexus sp. R2A61 TaxID=2744443 RepID=UPI001F19FBE9|nr:bacteriohemerythrin [Azonexus sp. R2A61]